MKKFLISIHQRLIDPVLQTKILLFTKIILLLCLVFGFDKRSIAQTKSYSITQYNTDNGLPQNSVKQIHFDGAGYCWMSTEMGLVRFDGKTFNTYGIAEIPGITSPRIKFIAPDATGNLYALTSNNEHIRIGSSSLLKAPYPAKITNSTKYIPITGYLGSKIYIDSLNDVLFRRDKRPYISEVFSLLDGEIYLKNQGNLFYITKEKAVPLLNNAPRIEGEQVTIVGADYCLFLAPGNRARVLRKGILQPGLTKIEGDLQNTPNLLEGKFKLLWCKNGTYLYFDMKLYEISIKNKTLHAKIIFENLDIPKLVSIYYAPEQNRYYLGSIIKGLYVIEPSSFTYPSVPKELNNNNFYSQTKSPDDQIFTGDILYSKKHPPEYVPLGSKDGMVTYISPDNQLYFEKNFTLTRYDLKTKKSYPLLVLNRRLRSLFPDGKDFIFCTERSMGIFSSDTVKMRHDFPDMLNIISSVRVDKDNFLLASVSGVKWYNIKKNKITRSILDSIQIRSIYQDGKDRLWIASYGRGFYLYENGKVYAMPFGPRESLRTVHAFIDDGTGYFWLPTNNGLFKVRKKDLLDYVQNRISKVYFYMFTKQNGLRTNEFNGGCDFPYVWLNDGMLSVSSIDGLVWFYPRQTKLFYPDKKIFIDKILIDNKSIGVPGAKNVVLEPDFVDMSLAISSPYFGNKENMEMEYMFEGIDNRWKPLPANGIVTVGRSPAGEYKIIMRRFSGLSNDPFEKTEFSFTVKPWFYNTWWFYFLSVMALMFVGYTISRQRLRSLIEKSRKLELLVATRTQELSSAVDQLAASESELLKSTRIKDKVIAMVLHDLRSPMSFLNTISNYLVYNHKKMDEHLLYQKLLELQSGTKVLWTFTEQFFAWASTQHEDFVIKRANIRIQDIFFDLTDLYKDILKNKGNRFEVQKTNLSCYTDYQILSLVLRNLIDNANKNTKDGTISLAVIQNDTHTIISIADTGIGLSDEQVKSFFNESNGLAQEGIGSVLILGMLKKIGGRLSMETSPNVGSTFTVLLNNYW